MKKNIFIVPLMMVIWLSRDLNKTALNLCERLRIEKCELTRFRKQRISNDAPQIHSKNCCSKLCSFSYCWALLKYGAWNQRRIKNDNHILQQQAKNTLNCKLLSHFVFIIYKFTNLSLFKSYDLRGFSFFHFHENIQHITKIFLYFFFVKVVSEKIQNQFWYFYFK